MNLGFFKRKKPAAQIRDRDYYESRFQYYWKELVPPMNEADTKQGELVRCIGNLEDEANRNGNENWDELNEEEVDYLTKNLVDVEFFDNAVCRDLRSDLDEIRKAGRNDVGSSADDEVYNRVIRLVVDWCDAHPEPIELRPRDPNIRRFERDEDEGLET